MTTMLNSNNETKIVKNQTLCLLGWLYKRWQAPQHWAKWWMISNPNCFCLNFSQFLVDIHTQIRARWNSLESTKCNTLYGSQGCVSAKNSTLFQFINVWCIFWSSKYENGIFWPSKMAGGFMPMKFGPVWVLFDLRQYLRTKNFEMRAKYNEA